jgi:hypothetical protein
VATRRATAAYKVPLFERRTMPLVWLVERDVDSRNLVTLTYATPDGDEAYVRQTSLDTLHRHGGVTAGVDVDADRMDAVDDDETRERYAAEATKMAERHDPDDEV